MALLGASVAIGGPLAAAESALDGINQKLSSTEQWKMSAPYGKPTPDCVETWIIRKDGTMTIQSGQERVQKKWRLGDDDGNASIFLQSLSSTGGRDCLGTEAKPYDTPKQEDDTPICLLSFRGGEAILLCQPQFVETEQSKEPSAFFGDNCWGLLEPIK